MARREFDISAVIENQKFGTFQALLMFWTCAIMFIDGYDMQVVGYAAPAIIKAWHADKASFGAVFGVGLFGYMLGATLIGNLGDRFGRRWTIIGGVFVFGVFTLAAALSTSITELLVLRFLAGLGLGGSLPNAIAFNTEYAPTRTRATRVAIMFVGYTAGGALGGIIAALVLPSFGWPGLFYIGGIVPIVLAACLVFVLPESVRFLAIKEGDSKQIVAILTRMQPGLFLPADVRLVLKEETKAGFPVKHLFSQGRAWMTSMLWTAFASSLVAIHFLTSWLPTLLESSGVALTHAVVATSLLQVGAALGGVVVCSIIDRRGPVIIALSFAIAVPLLAAIGSVGTSEILLMSLVFGVGFFAAGGQHGLNALSGTLYPTYIRSTGSGWAFGVGRVGSIIGPVIGGFLISFHMPIATLFLFAAAPVVCACAASFFLARAAKPSVSDQEHVKAAAEVAALDAT
jgi:AAHS family 4-hydroxybenzoate transporter-like MFS transporter